MTARRILILLTAAALVPIGCASTGKDNRLAAHRRINIVNAKLSYDQAKSALEAGRLEKALEEVSVAIELNPDAAMHYLLRGRVLLETHRLEEALKSFEQAIETAGGEYAEAHYYCGIVHQRWSDDQKAYRHYLTAHEQEPEDVSYLLAAAESLVALGRYEQARMLIEPKLAYFEHNAALRQLLGQVALLEEDPAKAAELLYEAWLFDPDDQLLLTQVAHAQYAARQYGKCLRSIQQLQELAERRDPELLHFKARCLSQMNRLTEARDIYLELTRLAPDDPEVWIDLGTVAWELGDFHRVALCGARVASLSQERFEGYLFKGVNEHHHGNLEEAVPLLRKAAARAEGEALPHLVLGRVLEELGDTQGAADAYAAAIRAEPDNEDAVALLRGLELATVPPSGGGSDP